MTIAPNRDRHHCVLTHGSYTKTSKFVLALVKNKVLPGQEEYTFFFGIKKVKILLWDISTSTWPAATRTRCFNAAFHPECCSSSSLALSCSTGDEPCPGTGLMEVQPSGLGERMPVTESHCHCTKFSQLTRYLFYIKNLEYRFSTCSERLQ